MTLKEFFDKHPVINQAAFAKEMWPNVKYPNTKLANKLANTQGQRITLADEQLFAKVSNNLIMNLKDYMTGIIDLPFIELPYADHKVRYRYEPVRTGSVYFIVHYDGDKSFHLGFDYDDNLWFTTDNTPEHHAPKEIGQAILSKLNTPE